MQSRPHRIQRVQVQRPVEPIVDELGRAGMNQEQLEQSLATIQGEVPAKPHFVREGHLDSTASERSDSMCNSSTETRAVSCRYGMILGNNGKCFSILKNHL